MLLLNGCAHHPYRIIDDSEASRARAVPGDPSLRAREVALVALSAVGVPYRYGGSAPSEGFDCSGLVQYAYSRAGVQLPRTTYAMSTMGPSVAAADLQPGDLVFFDTLRRPFSHVGIYIGDSQFIHAPTSGGVVQLVDMRQTYWRKRYDGARRVAP